MTENIIHFKSAKKNANHAKKEKLASENRVKFGRSKTQKRTTDFDKSIAKNHLDDRKLDDE